MHNEINYPTCGAKTRMGHPCKNAQMSNGRCRMHGGKSLKGVAHPSTKTAKYSKYLPPRIISAYTDMLNDPDMLATYEEIAVVRSRLADLMGRIGEGGGADTFKKAQSAYWKLDRAMKSGDANQTMTAMVELEAHLRAGNADYGVWHEIDKNLARLQRLVESERKRMIDAQQMITTTEAAVYFGMLQTIILEEVKDPKQLARIVDRLAAVGNHHRIEANV